VKGCLGGGAAALVLAVVWAGCGEERARCDEALGDVCRKGVAGSGGVGGGGSGTVGAPLVSF
jgi:hypothetical protein